MKKSLTIAAFAALTFTACNNSEKSSSDKSNQEQTVSAINQDSIDKAHGHSHDPAAGNQAPADADKALVQPKVNQDSIKKAHGHKH